MQSIQAPSPLRTDDLRYRAIQLSHSANIDAQVRQVVFGVDRKFLRHAAMVMLSISRTNPNERFHFHLISALDLSKYIQSLQQVIQGTGHFITLYQLDVEPFERLPQSQLFPISIYYRLVAPHLLDRHERVLYLDADMICLRTLSPLFHALDDREEVVAVVSDSAAACEQQTKRLGMAGGAYFNSGMLLINVRKWLDQAISEEAIGLLEQRGTEFEFPDQDALNIVLEGRALFIEQRYNTIFKLGHTDEAYDQTPPPDTVLLHYAGADKPWQRWNSQAATRFYRDTYARSPWADKQFERPRRSNQTKRLYKLRMREREFLRGIYWYMRYVFKRIRERA